MFSYPEFSKIKSNGVPILSRTDIDTIVENYIKDFDPAILTSPHALDVESFVECYMGANIEYQYLSHNCTYLGMAVFNDTDKFPIYRLDTQRAEYIHIKANTVIIENTLIDTKNEHRLRYTIGHESGHLTLNKQHYTQTANQMTLFNDQEFSLVKCKRSYIETEFSLKTDTDWMEWQANYFSGALLMPQTAMRSILSDISGYSIDSQVGIVADIFNVSRQAASIRITQMSHKKIEDKAQVKLF